MGKNALILSALETIVHTLVQLRVSGVEFKDYPLELRRAAVLLNQAHIKVSAHASRRRRNPRTQPKKDQLC